MLSAEEVRRLALALPEAVEQAHMGKPDFRVKGKIFASLPRGGAVAVVKLAPDHQASLMDAFPGLLEPAAGAWGRQGWTKVHLRNVDEDGMRGLLRSAWRTVAPPSLASPESWARGATPDL
jgi:hypothetical protein